MIGFRHVIQSTVDADVTVNVNSVNEGTFSSLSDINISVTDGTNPVTPDDVIKTGNNLEIQVPAATPAPVGATIMRTGQTVSYRTGDDANTANQGRDVSFTVLASNNPFGNTNRFTDELGGQTYTKNIVIDWSTYNGSKVFGFRRTEVSGTFNTGIDACLALSIAPFTTGWRMANIKEIMNLANYSISNAVFNYSPFNFPSLLYSSTTYAGNTANRFYMNATGDIFSAAKTISGNNLACRIFTVTGTTLS